MDTRDVLIGVISFGFGLLGGYVVCAALRPRPEKVGLLEGFLQALGARAEKEIVMEGLGRAIGQVPAWQIPRERAPGYTVGGLFEPGTEGTIAKRADELLLYL